MTLFPPSVRCACALAAITLVASLPLSAQTSAGVKSYTLAKVTVRGPSHFTSEQIAAAGGLRKGQQIDLAGVDAAADRLFKTGAIAKIGYSYSSVGNSMSVEFQITDASRFLPCLYDNFVWFADADLTAAVRHEVPLYDGSVPVGGEMVTQVSTALEHFLQEHKKPGTVTATMTGTLGGPISGYTLQVTGVSMPVVAIDVSGGSIGPEALSKATHLLIGKDYSRTLARGSGQLGLTEIYQDEGYLQAQFSEPQISLKDPQGSDASAGITIKYDVTPGPIYNWSGVSWNGNQSLPDADLTKLLEFKAGDIARRDKLELGWMAIKHAYGRMGYLEARTGSKPEFDPAHHQVHFEATVTEGPQYHMGEFSVTGVSEPLASKLKAAWKLRPGQVYDDSYQNTFLQGICPRQRDPAIRTQPRACFSIRR